MVKAKLLAQSCASELAMQLQNNHNIFSSKPNYSAFLSEWYTQHHAEMLITRQLS